MSYYHDFSRTTLIKIENTGAHTWGTTPADDNAFPPGFARRAKKPPKEKKRQVFPLKAFGAGRRISWVDSRAGRRWLIAMKRIAESGWPRASSALTLWGPPRPWMVADGCSDYLCASSWRQPQQQQQHQRQYQNGQSPPARLRSKNGVAKIEGFRGDRVWLKRFNRFKYAFLCQNIIKFF